MHEMTVVTSILDAVCERAREEGATRVVTIDLRVGVMRDVHVSLLQKYFEFFARDTLAQGVEVRVEMVPLRFKCDVCGCVYEYDPSDDMPRCAVHPQAAVTVVSGTELVIDQIGVV